MTKKFNKKRSLEEGEIVLDDVSANVETTEFIESLPTETTYVELEVAVPTSDKSEPTQAQIKFAKAFTGYPTPVDLSSIELAQSCVDKKLLAEFDTGSFARGSQWFTYCKR